MANTPNYKSLKKNGTTFYAFPGAAEDISAAYQNENYKMYFSKYALLNLPKQELEEYPRKFKFDSSFIVSSNAPKAKTFSEQIVESLRNYVANQEVTIRESMLNNTEYYYDNNVLETTTEKIFWKWCKKLNLIEFEPATPDDEYFPDLKEFESKDLNNDEYFPEYLWKERENFDWDIKSVYQSDDSDYFNNLEIEFYSNTNFKEGDIINIFNVSDDDIIKNIGGDDISKIETEEGLNVRVYKVIPPSDGNGEKVIIDKQTALGKINETTGMVRLVYNKLVRYIGEVNGISNVQEANRSYTEVHAHIPDHTGETPDILFRTLEDDNYRPNSTFPIIPSQFQPEIKGAEFYNSPIVSQQQKYPGSYFGQFDTKDFTYKTSSGDSFRRSGDYYGIGGDLNNIKINSENIDGLSIDFNKEHYVKMNIPNKTVTNFDQFNALSVNNNPPKDFEFNAILWYYTVEDNRGEVRTNLYGISFLDNPENNENEEERGIRFPTIKKLVTNGEQDGTSYAYNLSLNFNIINENPNETYNPEAINSMFSMNLFNKAMKKLSSTNDSFLKILASQSEFEEDLQDIKGLLYSQKDFSVINSKISNFEKLLRIYSTMQMVDSQSIEVNKIPGSPYKISLNSIDSDYVRVDNIKTSKLYNSQGVIPMNILVPKNKKFLLNINNDDDINMTMGDDEKLTILLDKDLYINQSVDINIKPDKMSSENKKLDIFMSSDVGSENGEQTEVLLLGDINLPVSYNSEAQLPNYSYIWEGFDFDIDLDKDITLESNNRLKLYLKGNNQIIKNSIRVGEVLVLNNLFIGDSTVYDFSGQYIINKVDFNSDPFIVLDISSNSDFVTTYSNKNIPYKLHSDENSELHNNPYFSLNKGIDITITRVSDSNDLEDRYNITVKNK